MSIRSALIAFVCLTTMAAVAPSKDFEAGLALQVALDRAGISPGLIDGRPGARTKDALMLVVAQRVSTITAADLILVLDNGRIVGQGTHTELLESSETYQEIVRSQGVEEEVA